MTTYGMSQKGSKDRSAYKRPLIVPAVVDANNEGGWQRTGADDVNDEIREYLMSLKVPTEEGP
jgi:hypothetical protein